jgi:hypothetical protein
MKDTRRRTGHDTGNARWQQWKTFQHGVVAVTSWTEAWEFAAQGPKSGIPGSSFYTNLCYFVRHNSVPLGADGPQVAIYDALVARLGKPTPPA